MFDALMFVNSYLNKNNQQCFLLMFHHSLRRHNAVGVATGDLSHDSDGRVWVEVGGPGLRLRVIHLHPANPALAELLVTRAAEARQKDQEDVFKLPADDEVNFFFFF